MSLSCYTLIFFIFIIDYKVNSNPLVSTPSGKFYGQLVSNYNGNKYLSFRGIKFASVTQRFQEAVPFEESNEILNATNFGPDCYQINGSEITGVEDCLYLNVYSPRLNDSIPVIVFIYGGSFKDGSSSFYSPDYFMESGKVVIVTISYRLGAFGFLYFDDPNYPANLGIRDQILGLRWVQKNVEHFGGDPNRVTIAGQSAGAASVSILMHSDAAKGLFVGAISESGTSCALWAVQPRCTGIQRLRNLAVNLNCTVDLPEDGGSAKELVECLRSKSPEDILKQTQNFIIYDRSVPFMPIMESESVKNPVITEYPWFNKTPVEMVPWITGVNSWEGSTMLGSLPSSKLAMYQLMITTPSFLPSLMLYANTASDSVQATEDIIFDHFQLYINNYTQFLVSVVSDGSMNFPFVTCISRNKAPSYAYFFDYLPSNQLGRRQGVGHSGELNYVWPKSLEVRNNGSKHDKEISNFLVNTWTYFAYHQSLENGSLKWERYDSTKDYVLVINNTSIQMDTNPIQHSANFWINLNLTDRPNTQNCN